MLYTNGNGLSGNNSTLQAASASRNEVKLISKSNLLGREINVYGSVYEPLFKAKDVAEWIEHSDVSTMMRNVDEDEKVSVTNPNNVWGGQSAWFLTEDGLYEVLMQSRKPIEQMDASIPFTDWGAKSLNNLHKFMREYLEVSNYLSTFAMFNISKGGTQEPQTIRWRYFYTLTETYNGIVPPWKSVMEIQPFEVLNDGKGNAVFLLPVFHKTFNNERN